MFASSKTASVSGGYQISRSLRFNSADSAYLNRTPAGAGNRTTWTWSGWIKFSKITGLQFIFGASSDNYANNFTLLQMDNAASTLTFYDYTSAYNFELKPSMVFRDPSAWYHIVWAYDSNAATSSDRVKIYVNGNQVTAFSTASYPTSAKATVLNSAVVHNYGTSSYPINGYLTETNFIDGQALTPSSFGETNAQTGVWQPKAYSGSYGTNGFYLNFSDNSNTTAATLGKDYSGNGNNWTPNNFSVTAGAGNDSLVDSPTSYGVDTGAGGTVRGNYCTLNPLAPQLIATGTLSNGNLDFAQSSLTQATGIGTIAITSGKWYWEATANNNGNNIFGIVNSSASLSTYTGGDVNGWAYFKDGQKYTNNSGSAYGSSWTTSDIIGIAFDADAGSLTFYKNGVSQGVAYSSLAAGTYFPAFGTSNSSVVQFTANFGQRAFAYTAPSGFKALCTQNLPTPTIGATTATQAGKYFNPVLYTGNGSTQSVTGVGFQPDFVWIKNRTSAEWHRLFDVVRGATKELFSNTTNAEGTDANSLTSFNTDGFSVGTLNAVNKNADALVAWNWKANGSGSTNTAGSITSTVSANTTSGFSVVTYTGTGANATVGHGLGAALGMIIIKDRTSGSNFWVVGSTGISFTSDQYLRLNGTGSVEVGGGVAWNSTAPTSTVFSIGSSSVLNASSNNYVAYCFAPIAGYSAFGSYTGNGSTDGPFVFTGMRPAFVMIKRTDSTANWHILDVSRNTYNVANLLLYPNLSSAEATFSTLDILSNGFKIRNSDVDFNASSGTYIYACFASNPFKYSLAR